MISSELKIYSTKLRLKNHVNVVINSKLITKETDMILYDLIEIIEYKIKEMKCISSIRPVLSLIKKEIAGMQDALIRISKLGFRINWTIKE